MGANGSLLCLQFKCLLASCSLQFAVCRLQVASCFITSCNGPATTANLNQVQQAGPRLCLLLFLLLLLLLLLFWQSLVCVACKQTAIRAAANSISSPEIGQYRGLKFVQFFACTTTILPSTSAYIDLHWLAMVERFCPLANWLFLAHKSLPSDWFRTNCESCYWPCKLSACSEVTCAYKPTTTTTTLNCSAKSNSIRVASWKLQTFSKKLHNAD